MDDQELQELKNPDNWEEVTGEVQEPAPRSGRAVVSVAFARDDFRQVVAYAEQHGMKTSEFIRKAALACTSPSKFESGIRIHSATGWFRSDHPMNTSRAPESYSEVQDQARKTLTTA